MEYQKLSDAFNISNAEVEALYSEMLKTTEESKRLNCRSCGFNTCEQMVAAIFLGMKHKSDCVQYAIYEAELHKQMQKNASTLVGELLTMCYLVEKERKNVLESFERFNAVMQMFDASVGNLRKALAYLIKPQ